MPNYPHEIRGPYEAFVIATKRKDGRCPTLEKVLASEHGDCPFMLFDTREEALAVCNGKNGEVLRILGSAPFGVFTVHITFIEEVINDRLY